MKKKKRKKLTCCQRCKRRIVRWLYQRTKKCCKKAIFGVPDPKLSDYDIAGVNLGDARDQLKGNKSVSTNVQKTKKYKNIFSKDTPEKGMKKSSVTTLYRAKRKSILSIPFKEKLVKEYEGISLFKPKGKNIKSVFSDFKERNLFVGLSKDSKLNITKSDRAKYAKRAKEYEEKYGKGAVLSELDKYKKSSYLNNDKKYKNISNLEFKLLESMDKDKLKNKLSITTTKRNVLKNMFSDYKKKKLSLTGVFSKSKVDIEKLDKDKINDIIEVYKAKKRNTFVKQSKIKQLKSDLRAKLVGLN